MNAGKPVAAAEQSAESIAAALESFFAEHPDAIVLEEGKLLFDMREAKYTLSSEHGRCTLHLWGTDRNLVRRVDSLQLRGNVLRMRTHRFGQTRAQFIELLAERDRRPPSTRAATRTRFVKVLQRTLERHFPDWTARDFRTAMDLEKSFGPAYARGLLTQGQKAWAVIAVNGEESLATVDGILTFGILWLVVCREASGNRRAIQGLKVIVPRGMAATTLSRMAWLAGDVAQWELLELDGRDEQLTARDAADHGNLTTHLVHAPNAAAAATRFAAACSRVLAIVPDAFRPEVQTRLRSGSELAFLIHGLEFARIRIGASAESFNRLEEISFGAGPSETLLNASNEHQLRNLVAQLCERRHPEASKRDPLYRMQPERWLESVLSSNLRLLDEKLDPTHVYSQVPAFAASDRGMLDLLSVTADGRLALLELKASEDPQLPLQGLDYWIRVRWHHMQSSDAVAGLGEFQRHGYFAGVRLSPLPPRLYLVSPALHVHPSTEIILRHLSPRVEWTLIALNESWRGGVKIVWRKRATDAYTS